MGMIEFYGWGLLNVMLEKFDWLIFDFDFDEGFDFVDIKKVVDYLKE